MQWWDFFFLSPWVNLTSRIERTWRKNKTIFGQVPDGNHIGSASRRPHKSVHRKEGKGEMRLNEWEKPQRQSGLQAHGLREVNLLGQHHKGSGGPRILTLSLSVKRGQQRYTPAWDVNEQNPRFSAASGHSGSDTWGRCSSSSGCPASNEKLSQFQR